MYDSGDKQILGIVGGMGPLASAEFLRTIYEQALVGDEQESPAVILYSDPTFPDRTDAFLAGRSTPLLNQLIGIIERLLDAGATRVVFCCMTIHYLLPQLPRHLSERVVSLLDVIYENLPRRPNKHLLICSTGTLKLELFQKHPRWPSAEPFIILPGEEDQRRIHRDLIYPIKKPCELRPLFALLESMLEKYAVDSFIAGCSEIHLLSKRFAAARDGEKNYACLDPLAIIAQELARSASGLKAEIHL